MRIITDRNHWARLMYRRFSTHVPALLLLKAPAVRLLFFINKYSPAQRVPICGVSDFAERNGIKKDILIASREENVPKTIFFSKRRYCPTNPQGEYESPDCALYTIQNARVIGRSDFLLCQGMLLHDDRYSPTDHLTTFEQMGVGIIDATKGIGRIRLNDSFSQIDQGINLTSGGSGNYAHFLTEVAPKLISIDQKRLFDKYPLIVDGWIGDRLTEILSFFNSLDREIIALDSFESVLVKKLVHVTSPVFAPQDFKCVDCKINHGESCSVVTKIIDSYYFSSESANLIRNYCDNNFPNKNRSGRRKRKIYIRRSGKFSDGFQYNASRTIINKDEVEIVMDYYGFDIIDIEKLSFFDQIEIFSNAVVVVGPLGAAMANCIFCRPGASVIGLAAYYDGADYSYHARMMASFGHRYYVVLGAQYKRIRDNSPLHRNYLVDIKSLQSALENVLLEQKEPSYGD